ncbi:MAG: alternative ribosome rescue aminoacyl-tRNA hydrolase ArfB [Polyangiaceae bacterium]|jgi:ribosome-associated protein
MLPLPVNGSITLPAACLTWSASRASGPGGQNVNKVSSKVELRFDLGACAVLDPSTKDRLRALASGMLDSEGRILIVSQKTRDQPKNLDDARDKLRELVLRALVRPKKRRPTRPSRGAVARRLDEKSRASKKKRERSGREHD